MADENTFTIKPAAENNLVFASDNHADIQINPAETNNSAARPLPPQESFYGAIPAIPTQEAPEGIRFDFNQGIRILFPQNGKSYQVMFADLDTEGILFSGVAKPGDMVTSVKKYFIRFRLMIAHMGETQPFFTHDFDAKDKIVMLQIPGGTIGDTIAWFSYAERFQQKHQCKTLIVMQPWLSEIFKKQYPTMTFITNKESLNYQPYATYHLGLFFRGDVDWQPVDFRFIGLHRTAGCILGVDLEEIPPRVDLSAPRKIKDPYVVIATQASSQAKYWNNPAGWHMVISFLHQHGYKVVCIDKEQFHGGGIVWNHIPAGVDIDDTGAKPLQERIDMIKDADFFIGLPSGLSWLAWCCKLPVVLIAGFSAPSTEFTTPYRIINYHACNSCWNDFRENFDHMDFLWCPRHKGTDRQFECSRMITGEQVIKSIKTIPAFIEHEKKLNNQNNAGDKK